MQYWVQSKRIFDIYTAPIRMTLFLVLLVLTNPNSPNRFLGDITKFAQAGTQCLREAFGIDLFIFSTDR